MAALQSLRQDVGKGHTHSQAKLNLADVHLAGGHTRCDGRQNVT